MSTKENKDKKYTHNYHQRETVAVAWTHNTERRIGTFDTHR